MPCFDGPTHVQGILMVRPDGAASGTLLPLKAESNLEVVLTAVHQRVLDLVLDRLSGRDLEWAVTGSAALALHGIATTCDDLDLVSTASGVETIEHAFTRDVVVRPSLVTRDGLRGHLGMLRIDGLAVELLGDIQNALSGGAWTVPPSIQRDRVWIERDGRRYPVLSLDYLHGAYAAMGRTETANLIAEHLPRTPVNSRGARAVSGGLFLGK